MARVPLGMMCLAPAIDRSSSHVRGCLAGHTSSGGIAHADVVIALRTSHATSVRLSLGTNKRRAEAGGRRATFDDACWA
jgi:hypothetical protein